MWDPDNIPPLDDFKPTEKYQFGDVMTVADYLDCVKWGAFIDYDGFGHPSNGTHEDDRHLIKPSDKDTKIPPAATHIIWYNR